MSLTRTRADRRERSWRQGRVSPLSAATLLLLVTMVVSSSPVGPKALPGRMVDDRTATPATAQAEQSQRRTVARRQICKQEQQPASAGLNAVALHRCVPVQTICFHGWEATGVVLHPVRIELLDLPPPTRA